MNLAQIRTEVLNTGFDQSVFGARINQYVNDGQNRIARYVEWFGAEGVYLIPIVAGTSSYAWPSDLARVRNVFNTATNNELQYAGLRDIDRSVTSTGEPGFFAVDGPNLHLYPTPDSSTYSLELRYWKLPPALVNDTDVPALPPDYHYVLISYALWKCYEREDDPQMAQYHEGEFKKLLAELKTDLTFPTSDEPVQVRGMWDRDQQLGRPGWSVYGGSF